MEYDGCLVAVRHQRFGRVEFLSTKICGPHGHCVSASEDRNSGGPARHGEFRCECDLGYAGEQCHISKCYMHWRYFNNNAQTTVYGCVV